MALLTPEQLAQIQQIIRDASSALGISTMGMGATKEDLQRLADQGFIDPKNLGSLALDAFTHGSLMARLPEAERMSAAQFINHVRRNPMPLSPEERAAAEVAKQRAGRYCVGLGDTFNRDLNQYVTVADQELGQKRRDLIRDSTAWAVEERRTRKELASRLKNATQDWARNWERIASTEMHLAHQEGFHESIVKRYGEGELMAKVPEPSACEDCVRLYLENGQPMIRPASWWEEQGASNVGRRRIDWKPVLGAMHPWCQCRLVRVPAGWGFNEDWDLVPPEIGKASRTPDDLAKARGHKYISKKPDGKGGWIYTYPEDKKPREKKGGRTVYLVACVGQKCDAGAPAADLYQSDWFKKARRLAEARGHEWMILSAEHGVVQPGQHLEPYNTTLNTMSEAQRRAWAAEVSKELKAKLKPSDRVVILAGENYRKHIIPELEKTVAEVSVPMKGLGIGEQKAWLKKEAEKGERRAPEQLDWLSMVPKELAKKAAEPEQWEIPPGALEGIKDPWEPKPANPKAKWSHPDYGDGTGEAPWQKRGWAPDLHDYDYIMVNTSGGKDSQAMMLELIRQAEKQGYPKEKMIAIHADLGRAEWAGTLEIARDQAKQQGLKFEAVSREKNDLVDQIEARYGTLLQRQVDTAKLLADGRFKTWTQLAEAGVQDVLAIIGSGPSTSEWTAEQRAAKMIGKAKKNLVKKTKEQEKKRRAAQAAVDKARARRDKHQAKIDAGSMAAGPREGVVKAQAAVDKAKAKLADPKLAVDYADQPVDFGAPIPWPSSSARFCTSDHKTVEVGRRITKLAEEREDKSKPLKVLNALGIRAQESDNREKMDSFGRQLATSNQVIDRWYPIHDWHEEKVWKEILEAKSPFHKAYRMGMRRLSCVFCVYAGKEDLMIAAKHNPELFQIYLKLEEKVGSSFKTDQSLADLKAEIQARRDEGYELNELAEWVKKSYGYSFHHDLIKAELAQPDTAPVFFALALAQAKLEKQGHKPLTVVIEYKVTGACLHLDIPGDSIHVDFLDYPEAYNASLMAAAYAQHMGLDFEEHNAPAPLPEEERADEELAKAAHKLHYRTTFQGFPISIENRAGSIRYWHDKHTDTQGQTKMVYPYGYIRLTEGTDGDHVDVFLGPHEDAPKAFVIHQMKAPDFKRFDEDKVMLGFRTLQEAKAAYLRHFDQPGFYGSCTVMAVEKFREKVFRMKRKMIKARAASGQMGFNWEAAPKSKRGAQRRRLPGGGYEYRYQTPVHAETARKVHGAEGLAAVTAVFVNVSGGSERSRFVPQKEGQGVDIASKNVHAQITAHEVPKTDKGRARFARLGHEKGMRLMIDSGEFGRFGKELRERKKAEKEGREPVIPQLDFDKIFDQYEAMAELFPKGKLTVVAPDRIADPKRTAELREQYAGRVKKLQRAGAEVIVPIQARSAEEIGKDYIAATKVFGEDITLGFPTAAAVLPMEEILPAMAQLYGHGKFPRIHFLGGGRPREMAERTAQLVAAAYFAGRGVEAKRVLELTKTPDLAARALRNVKTQDAVNTRESEQALADRFEDWAREQGMDPGDPDFDETEAWPEFFEDHPEEFDLELQDSYDKPELFRKMARGLVQMDSRVVGSAQQYGLQHDPITGTQIKAGEKISKLPKAERHPATLQAFLEAREHQTERYTPDRFSAWTALLGDYEKVGKVEKASEGAFHAGYDGTGIPNTGVVRTMGHQSPGRTAGANIESGGRRVAGYPVGKDEERPKRRAAVEIPPQEAMDIVGNPEKHGWARELDLDQVDDLEPKDPEEKREAGRRHRESLEEQVARRHGLVTPETFTPPASYQTAAEDEEDADDRSK